MSDVRSLLRQQRAARRIEHPQASYSDAGKLLCILCREAIKSESLWDGHIRSPGHRSKLQELQALKQGRPMLSPGDEGLTSKRKHDDVDESMSEADENADSIRRKRSRPDMTVVSTNPSGAENDVTATPPALPRRTSSTPIHGIEISIPSRPATPLLNDNSNTSTPKIQPPTSNSPFIGSDGGSGSQPSTGSGVPTRAISTEPLRVSGRKPEATEGNPSGQNGQVDEDEWAAFEADIASSNEPAPAAEDATISAPAMTAEQVAAKSAEEEQQRKKQLLDAQIADEREDATRALEDEFDEMEELEGRVRKLKERREELRKGSVMNLRKAAEGDAAEATKPKTAVAPGKENNATNGNEEDDSDEDDDDDDWVGFRFKA